MLDDYSASLRVCLVFVSLSPEERLALLPSVWTQPADLDNGYPFTAEQPLHVMADYCGEWLRLQECWEDLPAYTALALQSEAEQKQFAAALEQLRQEALCLPWQDWAARPSDSVLNLLALLYWPSKLTQQELYEHLNTHTYGTFGAALGL